MSPKKSRSHSPPPTVRPGSPAAPPKKVRPGPAVQNAATPTIVPRYQSPKYLTKLFRKSDEEIIAAFFTWIGPWWPSFWSRFRADGSMSWPEFELYVHWEGKWSGDTRRAFDLLDVTGDGKILTHHCLMAFREWQRKLNMLEMMDANEFRRLFSEYYGNLGRAWRLALDKEDTGKCPFLTFCRECHAIGLKHHMKSVWAEMTGHQVNRMLRFSDFDPDGDRLITQFVLGLTVRYGSVKDGWHTMIQDAGGHMHRSSFVEACKPFGIDTNAARWLFLVLDPHKTRYITSYDKVDFLLLWDPGDLSDKRPQSLQLAPFRSIHQTAQRARSGAPAAVNPLNVTDKEPYEFILVLSEEEHKEFSRRRRQRELISGIDAEREEEVRQRKKQEEEEEAAKAAERAVDIVKGVMVASPSTGGLEAAFSRGGRAKSLPAKGSKWKV